MYKFNLTTPISKISFGAGGFTIFVLLWIIISYLIGRERLPPPYEVIQQFFIIFKNSPVLSSRGGPASIIPHIQDSILKYIIGASAGIIIGISLGLLMTLNSFIYDLLILPIEGIRTIPALALTPFLLLWFGPTPTAAIILIIVYITLMLVINTLNAIENVPIIYMQFARTLGANKSQIFKTVIIPAIIPELKGAIRVALSRSWGLLVVAELMGIPKGLGNALTLATPYFAISTIIAVIIIITILANITDLIFVLATNKITQWMPKHES